MKCYLCKKRKNSKFLMKNIPLKIEISIEILKALISRWAQNSNDSEINQCKNESIHEKKGLVHDHFEWFYNNDPNIHRSHRHIVLLSGNGILFSSFFRDNYYCDEPNWVHSIHTKHIFDSVVVNRQNYLWCVLNFVDFFSLLFIFMKTERTRINASIKWDYWIQTNKSNWIGMKKRAHGFWQMKWNGKNRTEMETFVWLTSHEIITVFFY